MKLEATVSSTVWYLLTKLYGAVSQQTIFVPFMAMVTSDFNNRLYKGVYYSEGGFVQRDTLGIASSAFF
jgi:hypothetical protein